MWEELRNAIRASPDHLAAGAERVVAGRDPAAIHAWVRDRIALLPVNTRGFGDQPECDVRWGEPHATLRGGAGTPREKAELLADLLRRAGFEAEICAGRPSADAAALRQALCRPVNHEFAPALAPTAMAAWRTALGLGPDDSAAPGGDDADTRSRTLGRRLTGLLPGGFKAEPIFDAGVPAALPLVRVRVGGTWTYANPLMSGLRFGESGSVGEPAPAGAPRETLPVKVRLSVTTTAAPRERVTVAEGAWKAGEVVGRQLLVQFIPTAGLDSLAGMQIRDVRTFRPVLAVRAPGLAADEARRLAVLGSVVSVEGDIVASKPTGETTVNGVALAAAPAGTGAERVSQLEVEVRPSAFPSIDLGLRALDAEGRPVEGLDAAALRVKEDGRAQGFLMRGNRRPPPPRVLLLFDHSDSIPADFRDRGATALARNLATRLLAADQAAEIQVAAVYSIVQPSGTWTRDPAAVAEAVGRLKGYGSDLWQAVASTQAFSPSVVVLVSDGAATDLPTPALVERIRRGPPVVALAVGDERREDILRELAELSGGRATGVADAAEAVAVTLGFLKRREGLCCDLNYLAPEDGARERTVRVETADGRVSGEARYRVPDANRRATPTRLAGIYLHVSVGGEEVVRVLAGAPDPAERPPSPALLARVQASLFGGALLSFEGTAPTLAAWLDDLLTSKLSLRPLQQAVARNDRAGLLDAFAGGFGFLPTEFIGLHAPLPDARDGGSLTFECGLRVVLYAEQPDFDTGVLRRSDILPLTRFATLAGDPDRAFRLTLERTARLAVAEDDLFPVSTARLLEGEPLAFVDPYADARSAWAKIDEEQVRAWRNAFASYAGCLRLAPRDGDPVVFWAVHARTGSLWGVMQSGGGEGAGVGGVSLPPTGTFFAAAGILGAFVGAGLGFGMWLSLGQAIVRQVNRATIAIANMEDPEHGADPIEQVLRDLVRDLLLQGLAAGLLLGASGLLRGLGGLLRGAAGEAGAAAGAAGGAGRAGLSAEQILRQAFRGVPHSREAVARAALERPDVFVNWVNRYGHQWGGATDNCAYCVESVERWLSGQVNIGALPYPAGRSLEQIAAPYGTEFLASLPSQLGAVEQGLIGEGNGARGILYMENMWNGESHVINVVNQNGTIVAIDAQAGVDGITRGGLAEAANVAGYGTTDVRFSFARTWPP